MAKKFKFNLKQHWWIIALAIIGIFLILKGKGFMGALIPGCVSDEPIINNRDEALVLWENEGVMVFTDILDSENLFYDTIPAGGLCSSRYCTKGTLVGCLDSDTGIMINPETGEIIDYESGKTGCVYPVADESECIPDPAAPENEAVYHPDDGTCVVHYIHSRAYRKCLTTGEIFDWNIPDERAQLETCPDCDWFNVIISNPYWQGQPFFKERRTINGVTIAVLESDIDPTVEAFMFCTNNQIKMSMDEPALITYLNNYLTCGDMSCTVDSDCTQTASCSDIGCVDGICQFLETVPPPHCEGEDYYGELSRFNAYPDCTWACEERLIACAFHADCPTDSVCNFENGFCVLGERPECTINIPCPSDSICESGTCVPITQECTTDADCESLACPSNTDFTEYQCPCVEGQCACIESFYHACCESGRYNYETESCEESICTEGESKCMECNACSCQQGGWRCTTQACPVCDGYWENCNCIEEPLICTTNEDCFVSTGSCCGNPQPGHKEGGPHQICEMMCPPELQEEVDKYRAICENERCAIELKESECISDTDCTITAHNDCSIFWKPGETEQGSCDDGICSYVEYAACTPTQLWLQQYIYWLLGGIAILSIIIYVKRKEIGKMLK